MLKKILLIFAVLFIIGAAAFFFVLPKLVEMKMNRVLSASPGAASEAARNLHARLTVADLHADSLMWDRDLLERAGRGQVDVPRLVEGNVALQAFTVVTKTPRGMNIERNDDRTDNITPLVIANRWPLRTWSSLKERALYQARKLHALAEASDGRLVLIKSSADLARHLERRRGGETRLTAGLLGIEGAHALEGDPANVEVMFDAGFRMMSPTHFFDNEMGGSAHGIEKGGLTGRGREMIRRMEARGMLVDLAHASAQTIDDVLGMATRPVVVSHTGVRANCDNARNLTDDQLRRIAATGGIVGIGFWETAVCGRDARSIARAIRQAASLIGVEHVALGSDFDGAVTTPFDAAGLVLLTEALSAEGFTSDDIEKIMGANVIRLLSENLPR